MTDLERLIENHRQEFGGPDTIRVLVTLYGYSRPHAKALVKRLKKECAT
jgi:hypothetical protein